MTQFKEGDKVIVIAGGEGAGFQYSSVGKIGTIRIIDRSTLPVLVDFEDGNADWGVLSELELFNPTTKPVSIPQRSNRMESKDVKIGQKVRIVGGGLFYAWNINKLGTVSEIDGDYITVLFEDGDDDDDYGYASGLELVAESPLASSATVRQAIADVEVALAALKALVG